MKKPKREYALVNLIHREIGKRRGKPILHTGPQPPRDEDFPKDFSRREGWSFEPVETVVDPRHVGPPSLILADQQVGRVSRIIGKQ